MKKLIYIVTFLMLSTLTKAQVTLNFESGNASTDEAIGWSFYRNTYTNTNTLAGTWSAQTYPLRNSDIDSCWIKSPWIVWNAGTITFSTKLRSLLATTRGIVVRFIPFDNCALNHEGTPSDTILYKNLPINSGTQNHSFAVPSLVQDGKRWRMMVSFLGTGGGGRNMSDLYSLPGTLANPVPSGANVYNGNVNLYTQAQVDAFINPNAGANYLSRYTKINGNLRIKGDDIIDPITCLANLRSLTEVTGSLIIEQFEVNGNPSNLSDLSALTKAGRLTIISNPNFLNIELPGLTNVDGALIVRNNNYANSILLPNLSSVGGSQFMIALNHRAESIIFSDQASSFNFTNLPEQTSVLIFDNGINAANPVTMDFNKITVVKKDFLFNNNSNSGISNFDNIFSSLDTVYGAMTITNNSYLSKCCVAASTVVQGGRTINGNTGNCADLSAVSADCGTLYKRRNIISKPIAEVNNQIRLQVYPNPNKGNFNLNLATTQSGLLKFTVTDLMGRMITNQELNVNGETSFPINMSYAAEGQYILKAEFNGQTFTKRIMFVK
jgi:hypothetical protein